MSFTIRTTPPDRSDTRYYEDSPFYPAYGLPNCTAYAWSRFWEISGTRPKLSTGNAGEWWAKTSDGYQRGQTPRPGAVMCWSKPGAAGHVAIVERVNSDGSVFTSESGWKASSIMWNQTRTGPNWANSPYVFQGFIYNPAVEYADYGTKFAQEAEKHLGEGGTWSWSYSLLGVKDHWCAAFVVAVARSLGLMNKVIAQCYTADMKASEYEEEGKGKVYNGPILGNVFTPKPGDLIMFNWSGKKTSHDHVGIVYSVSNGKVTTIEGNSGGGAPLSSKVQRKEYLLSYGCILKYYRPNWSLVGGYFEDSDYTATNLSSSTTVYGPLFDTESTKQDASIREIGYVNSLCEPSITPSDIRLSVVNYTSLLSALYNSSIGNVLAGSSGYTGSSGSTTIAGVDLGNLNTVGKGIVNYCVGEGLNVAAGIGIAANVFAECSFDISKGPIPDGSSYSGGMCMWNGTNWTRFLEYCGNDWKTNLTKQCQFMFYFMETLERGWIDSQVKYHYGVSQSLKTFLSSVSNNEAGAKKAAEAFCLCYENPYQEHVAAEKRAGYASQFWKEVTIII